MFQSTEKVIVILAAVISTFIAIITTVIAGYVINHFANPNEKNRKIMKMKRRPSKSTTTTECKSKSTTTKNAPTKSVSSDTEKCEADDIAAYFKFSASILQVFNAGCSLFNAAYSIHLLLDPHYDDNVFYINHPSHYFRIISTICWYIGTIALVWFFNGRLFFAFKSSAFSLSKTLFYAINMFVTVTGLISVVVAYWAVYTQNLVVAEVAFNSFRILYLIITFILLYMFSKRLLHLIMQEQSMPLIIRSPDPDNSMQVIVHSPSASGAHIEPYGVPQQQHPNPLSIISKSAPIPKPAMEQSASNQEMFRQDSQRRVELDFLQVTARNSVLVFVTSTSVALVTFFWCSFRFLFLPQTRFTLLIPMNMASIDSLVNSICVIMMIPFGDPLYTSLCNCCNQCFMNLCRYAAKSKKIID